MSALKLPWSIDADAEYMINNCDGIFVGEICGKKCSNENDIERAAFVVKAANAHDALVEAAKAFLKYFGSDDPETNILAMTEDYSTATEVQEKCRAALAMACAGGAK